MTHTHTEVAVENDENLPLFKRHRVFVREISGKYNELFQQMFTQPRIYHAGDKDFRGGPQHWVKGIIGPGHVAATQLFECHIDVYAPTATGQKHAHMNSAIFYILDGEGYDVHDGVRYDWKAGDVCIVEPGCVHQHFNSSDTEPARMLVMKAKPTFMFAHLLYQRTLQAAPTNPIPGFEDFEPTFFGD